jgi:hypothetical protein
MRRIALGLLCCTLAALPAVAGAAKVRTNCAHRYPVPLQGLAGIGGAYELSNGDTLQVTRSGTRYFANMGRTGTVEIVTLDDDQFAERGGPLRFVFDRSGMGDAGVTVRGLDAQRPHGAVCSPRPGCYGSNCPR